MGTQNRCKLLSSTLKIITRYTIGRNHQRQDSPLQTARVLELANSCVILDTPFFHLCCINHTNLGDAEESRVKEKHTPQCMFTPTASASVRRWQLPLRLTTTWLSAVKLNRVNTTVHLPSVRVWRVQPTQFLLYVPKQVLHGFSFPTWWCRH